MTSRLTIEISGQRRVKVARRKGEKREWTPSNSARKRQAITKTQKAQFDELRESWRDFFAERPDHFISPRGE